jgi:hypothetical protein
MIDVVNAGPFEVINAFRFQPPYEAVELLDVYLMAVYCQQLQRKILLLLGI